MATIHLYLIINTSNSGAVLNIHTPVARADRPPPSMCAFGFVHNSHLYANANKKWKKALEEHYRSNESQFLISVKASKQASKQK